MLASDIIDLAISIGSADDSADPDNMRRYLGYLNLAWARVFEMVRSVSTDLPQYEIDGVTDENGIFIFDNDLYAEMCVIRNVCDINANRTLEETSESCIRKVDPLLKKQGTEPLMYFESGGDIRIYPVVAKRPIRVSYIPEPSEITESSRIRLPAFFKGYLVAGVLYYMWQDDNMAKTEYCIAENKKRWEFGLDMIVKHYADKQTSSYMTTYRSGY